LAVHAAFKRYIEPSLGAFASYDLTQDPKTILMKLIDKGSVLDVISDLEDEFLMLDKEIRQKYEIMDLNYPCEFAVESNSAFLMYSLVRLL